MPYGRRQMLRLQYRVRLTVNHNIFNQVSCSQSLYVPPDHLVLTRSMLLCKPLACMPRATRPSTSTALLQVTGAVRMLSLCSCISTVVHAAYLRSHIVPSSLVSLLQFFMLLIFVNTAMLALEYNDQPESLTKFQEDTNYVLTALFTLEMILKLFGLGFWDYVRVSLQPASRFRWPRAECRREGPCV